MSARDGDSSSTYDNVAGVGPLLKRAGLEHVLVQPAGHIAAQQGVQQPADLGHVERHVAVLAQNSHGRRQDEHCEGDGAGKPHRGEGVRQPRIYARKTNNAGR